MYGLDVKETDTIVTLSSEYGTNLLTIYDIVKKTHCGIKVIECGGEGNFDLLDVEHALESGGNILAISHVAAQGSIVNPVVELGRLAQKYNAIYVVDGCQAVGQMNVDVQKINCCAYVTAGRKWLRGPRGTGILYVRKNAPIHSPSVTIRKELALGVLYSYLRCFLAALRFLKRSSVHIYSPPISNSLRSGIPPCTPAI